MKKKKINIKSRTTKALNNLCEDQLELLIKIYNQLKNELHPEANMKYFPLRFKRFIRNRVRIEGSTIVEINISSIGLEKFPEQIEKIWSLVELNLSGNAIEAIPENLTYPNLEVLDLSSNNIRKMPERMYVKDKARVKVSANMFDQGVPFAPKDFKGILIYNGEII